MKKIFYLLMASAIVAGFTACGSKAENKTEEEAETQAEINVPNAYEGVINLENDSLFRPTTEVAIPTVLDFNATWCVPCKKLTPAYHIVADEYKGQVAFYSVDIEANPETATAFEIESVPTVVILLPNGTMQRHVGLGDFVEGSIKPDEVGAAPDSILTPIIADHLKRMVADEMYTTE